MRSSKMAPIVKSSSVFAMPVKQTNKATKAPEMPKMKMMKKPNTGK